MSEIPFKSSRKLDEELKEASREHFEEIMERVDRGELSLELAMVALRE
jgi:exonuclease VII small subunit